jgi:phosphatidylserine decarboxylase
MNDAFIVSALSLVPKHPTARFMGWTARIQMPGVVQKAVLRWYVNAYNVDLTECEGTIDDYASLAEFFVRPLRPGVRPVDPDPDVLVSPVDGKAHTFGRIENGKFLQADGKPASVAELLGAGDPRCPGVPASVADRFEGGNYAVIYLSPRDYHRVHTPCSAAVEGYRYLPGQLWPVFPAATRSIPELFGRNERLVFDLKTPFGDIAYAMIGAFGVGRMATTVSELVTHRGNPGEARTFDPPRKLGRADELGRFELGSTVILFTEPGAIDWTLTPGAAVKLGEPIARRCTPSA